MPGRISSYLAALSLSLAASAVACNNAPTDLRQWKATDHDHTLNPNADQVQVTDAGSEAASQGLDDVTIVAWRQNCTSCHGALGRGDGPQGQLVHAADLSRPDWQASVTDEAIATTIREGRGRMPSFKLPDATVKRLVVLIRMLELNRMERIASAVSAGKAGSSAAGSGGVPPRA